MVDLIFVVLFAFAEAKISPLLFEKHFGIAVRMYRDDCGRWPTSMENLSSDFDYCSNAPYLPASDIIEIRERGVIFIEFNCDDTFEIELGPSYDRGKPRSRIRCIQDKCDAEAIDSN